MGSDWVLMHTSSDFISNHSCNIFKKIPEIKEWYVCKYPHHTLLLMNICTQFYLFNDFDIFNDDQGCSGPVKVKLFCTMHSTIEIHPGGEMSENKNAGEEWQTRETINETNEQCTCCIYVRMHLSLVCFQIICDYICVYIFVYVYRTFGIARFVSAFVLILPCDYDCRLFVFVFNASLCLRLPLVCIVCNFLFCAFCLFAF